LNILPARGAMNVISYSFSYARFLHPIDACQAMPCDIMQRRHPSSH
jgi:hypothetical protein